MLKPIGQSSIHIWFNKGQGQRSIKTCNKVAKRKMSAFIHDFVTNSASTMSKVSWFSYSFTASLKQKS